MWNYCDNFMSGASCELVLLPLSRFSSTYNTWNSIYLRDEMIQWNRSRNFSSQQSSIYWQYFQIIFVCNEQALPTVNPMVALSCSCWLLYGCRLRVNRLHKVEVCNFVIMLVVDMLFMLCILAVDCRQWNGGCQHLCVQSTDGVTQDYCECQPGFIIVNTTVCFG
jgi:hypothetical protein